MKFSELLNTKDIDEKKAFILGMIYARPIFLKGDIILAYSSYKKGTRSGRKLRKSTVEYYEIHKDKLQKYLGDGYSVVLNSDIDKDSLIDIKKNDGGVSVKINQDFKISKGVNLDVYVYGLIEKWLIDIEEKYKKIFLAGALDARGSLDFTMKYISMDMMGTPLLVKRKLSKYNDIVGAIFNYNPRLTQERAYTKNDQFRLPLFYYIGNFGLFTPFKIDYYKSEIKNLKEKKKADFLFIDGQYEKLEMPENYISERNLKINSLAVRLQKEDLSQEEKREIIEEWKRENLSVDTDDEIIYSSQNMKETAKRSENYRCEHKRLHKTFIAKSNGKNYVEGHHLIPFSERKNFDISIDIVENIVCLCPNCHRKIHLAADKERKKFIKQMFKKKSGSMKKAGIDIDLERLCSFYGVQ